MNENVRAESKPAPRAEQYSSGLQRLHTGYSVMLSTGSPASAS